MSRLLSIVFYILLPITAVICYKDYKNYQVYELLAQTKEQQTRLLALSKLQGPEFFGLRRDLNATTRVLVPPKHSKQFLDELVAAQLPYNLLVSDLSPLMSAMQADNMKARARSVRQFDVFGAFYRHDEINTHLDNLSALYPKRAFVKTFGRSYEKRPLKLITITNGDGRTGKKIIFIDATIHAREWITTSMALYIMRELLENFEAHAALLLDYDWVIMPVVNADGYEYTHDQERFWRKTRQPTNREDCVGTDLNRNFGHEWGLDSGSSLDPCEEDYRGKNAFSEPEAIVLRDILVHYRDRMKFYLSLHSYGNYILLPWGYTKTLPDNYQLLMEIAEAGAMAILQATNGIYTFGSGALVLYETSGDSADYAAGEVHVPVAMTMEMPASGALGFDPWVSHIEDMVTETWAGIRAMAEQVVQRY